MAERGAGDAASAAIAAVALAKAVGSLVTDPSPRRPTRSASGGEGGPSTPKAARRAAEGTDPAAEGAAEQSPAEARQVATEPGRGRRADTPKEIPAKGWKDIAKRVVAEVKADNVPLLSAGVAFYALLSLFPAVVAVVSMYGLVADPSDVAKNLESITRTMPADAADLLLEQVRSIAGTSSGALGVGVAVGIVTALWSASSGMKWLISALSLVYDEREGRKFVKLRGTALILTLAAAVALVVSLALIAGASALARVAGLGDAGQLVVSVLRWPLLGVLVVAGVAALYRYGPDREEPKWRWVSWGSGIAAVIWLAASSAFAVYAAVAGDFAASYGSVGGVVVMMLWLYISVLSVLIGAEINAEMEHQTAKDTTEGSPKPLGARHAVVADEVAPASN